MVVAREVVEEARDWRGTPFHWQACMKGVGCDCKGLVAGVARALGLPEGDSLHAAMANYGPRVPVGLLKAGLELNLVRVAAPSPGDVLLLTMGGSPQHLGIHAGETMIHTYNGGPKQVIETRLAAALRCWPLHSAWRFASLDNG